MIKTWLIIIFASIFMTINLILVNLMLVVNSDLLLDYLKQKMRVILVNSCVNDFFESISVIVDDSISRSNGNFSIMKEILEDETGKFIGKLSKTRDFLEKCGLKIYFEKSIVFYNHTEEYVIEITAEVYAEDSEGLFSIRRSNKIVRTLVKETHREITSFSQIIPHRFP